MGPPVRGYRVDEPSVIRGRHSTTFRLLLDRGNDHHNDKSSSGGVFDYDGDTTTRDVGMANEHHSGFAGGESSRKTTLCGNQSCNHGGGCQRAEGRVSVGPGRIKEASPTSVFVKRVVCSELPPRSVAKWR